MKKIQGLLLAFAVLLMGYSAGLRAEDIDIYVDNAATLGTPNVLFVLDNGADFSESINGTGCTAYGDGSGQAPSLGSNKASGILQCALVNAINALPDGAVNIGVLVSNGNNFAETQATTDPTKGGYHETCSSSGVGGCVIRKLTYMDATNKANLIKFIKGWKDSGQSDANGFNVKVNTAYPATMMQEAWAYYNGSTGLSGKNYATSLLSTGCQKNFIIYITNAQSDPPSSENGTASAALDQANGSEALSNITGQVKFNPAVCGSTSSYTLTASNNWADEWAKLMLQQDGGASGNENVQNIISYSVAIEGPANKCKPEKMALASSIAANGGGKFFLTSDVSSLTAALNQVLNEVQAVNSVFSSASLPVSVNAEGTYLNQIYLGMFRPDSSGAPRWMGNLKQYQLVKNSQGKFVMGDKTGQPALSSSGTGFLSPNAISFWTYKNTAAAPDDSATGGFFKNNPLGVLKHAYDSPDGEVVEKGGVAQQLRKENLTADFSGAAGTTNNPRRLYTYCPAGTNCQQLLTHSSNEFSTANGDIGAAAFGSSTTIKVNSMIRSGTTATVTTNGPHGFSAGTAVTISGASPSDYNGNWTVASVPSSTTFTISGLNDYPRTPAQGSYSIARASASSFDISLMTRTTGGGANETVTVTTATAHNFTHGGSVTISGADPTTGAAYNNTFTISYISPTQFSFSVPITPSPSATGWTAQISSTAHPQITGVTLSNPATGTIEGSTSSAHGLHQGQTVTISGASNNKYNGTFTIASVPSPTTFSITGAGNSVKNLSGGSGTVTPSYTPQTISLSRTASTDTTEVAVSGAPTDWFGHSVGDTKSVIITKSGATASESGYAYTGTVTCTSSGCTTFKYSVAVLPRTTAAPAGGQTLKAAPGGAASITIASGQLTRSGTTARVDTGLGTSGFATGDSVTISSSTSYPEESGYIGTFTITCVTTPACASFTFEVPLTPAASASGNIQAYSGSTPPDRDTVIKWVRGHDNYGDEKGPGGSVTVRPSIHGDVLHSRPVVINYGDTRGIVVYYGANDGVFRAINGNKTSSIGSVPAGGELWGLIFPEHYGAFNRLRTNTPELKFPSTALVGAQPKDYFVDGPTGAYQVYKADGTIDKAYIYVTMRRGGRFMYAIDVTQPAAPKVLWKIDNGTAGFEELGQTWSRPRLTLLQAYGTTDSSGYRATPVLVFGGGYDPNEDSEPPVTDTMGRGIYVVNAETGALVWSSTKSCTASATCYPVSGMTHAIPAEVRFVDRDGNGYTDKMYFADLGGNVWRADVNTSSPSSWRVTKIAALGCESGACPSGTTPRKFFFPPEVLTVGTAGAANSYDVVFVASGDREHPLKNTATGSSYNVSDKAFMIKDTNTALGAPSSVTVLTKADLFDATSTRFPNRSTDKGFFITFATGEKAVNGPLGVNGQMFFATNRPVDRTAMCAANLGEAKAYAVDPFNGETDTNVLAGGGLPPGAVTGLVTVDNGDGTSTTTRLCLGCGGVGGNDDDDDEDDDENVGGLENTPPPVDIDKQLRRTYWYKK